MSEPVIGIDLGTTNSCVATLEGGQPVVIPNSEGSRTTPSVVAFSKEGERLVGITCPAYFSDAQRKATQDAGRIAGLEVLRIINEPTAAALAYGVDKEEDQTILVFDLGGGTFDVSILDIYQVDGQPQIEVKATSGDNRLGGDDFDDNVVEWIVSEFKKSSGIDLSKDLQAMSRLREAAEKAKIELSGTNSSQINLPFITMKDGQPEHLDMSISRAKFEDLTADLINRTMKPTRSAMKDAGVKAGDIDKILLVGGSTRIPAVQDAIEKEAGKAPFKGINPDEAVAVGAALQAGIIVGDEGVTDVLLLDVTPLTLGIETLGGVMTTMIERNTTIPTRRSENFSTAADNQPAVEVHVLQGEREFAKDNITLGRFHLMGIPPAPRGIPQIEVTFDIDANGIVDVSAKDLGTGTEQSIKIESQTSLSEDEIAQKIADAEKFANEDKLRRAGVDLLNTADSVVYQTKRMLDDAAEKIQDLDSEGIHSKLDDLKKLITKDDGETPIEVENIDEAAIQAKMKEVEEEMHEISTKMYEAAAAEMAEQQAAEEDDEEDVEEADFEVVDSDEEESDD